MLRRRISDLPWLYRALLVGGVVGAAWSLWPIPGGSLTYRAVHDALLFILIPGALAVSHGRNLGWNVNRAALRNTVLLALFVLPFYLVGSSLPTIRAYYPMWHTSTNLVDFLPHAAQQLLVVVAAETYYRGLLCVGVREIGRKSALISPILYAFHHFGKPPIEIVLSAPTDVLFGLVDYESDSILPSIVAHGFGLILLDWLVLHPPLFPPEDVIAALQWLPIPI
ncbi:CPBP family intramembrane glutamic endopeptidase [Haloferax sp. DFSO60]|uniref:CPBP family intramembrane glutamic endopeptidase n=1 Tax=Haloferax sp. DFSO60 TaxID=3388652 RepID=UPI00397C0622